MRRKSERTRSSDVSSPATRRTSRRGRKSPTPDSEATIAVTSHDDEQQQFQLEMHHDEKVSEKEIEVDNNEKPPQNRHDSSSDRGESNDDDGLPQTAIAGIGSGSRSKRKSRTPAKSPSKRGAKRGRRFASRSEQFFENTTIIEENGNEQQQEMENIVPLIEKSDVVDKNNKNISETVAAQHEQAHENIKDTTDIRIEISNSNKIQMENIQSIPQDYSNKFDMVKNIDDTDKIKKSSNITELPLETEVFEKISTKEQTQMKDDKIVKVTEKIEVMTEPKPHKISPIKVDKPRERRRRFDVRPPGEELPPIIETEKSSSETIKSKESDKKIDESDNNPPLTEKSEDIQSTPNEKPTTSTSTVRKRRWLSRKTSETTPVLAISTDSLKNLISDVHPVPLSDVKLDSSPEHEEDVSIVALEEKVIIVEEHDQQKQQQHTNKNRETKDKDQKLSKIVERKDNTNKEKEYQRNNSGGDRRDKDSKLDHHRNIVFDRSDIKRGSGSTSTDEKLSISTNRKISIVNDEEKGKTTTAVTVATHVPTQRPPSPPKNSSSSILYITNLVRPFTVLQLKGLLARTGKIIDNGFWIDRIKSKCFVQYENEDEAVETRHALHGVRWPASNPKCLNVDFGTKVAMEKAVASTLEESTPKFGNDNSRDNRIIGTGWDKEKFEFDEKKDNQVSRPVREWDVGKKEEFERENHRMRERGERGDPRGGERSDLRDHSDRDRNERGGGGGGDRDRDRERDLRRRHSNDRENYRGDRRRSYSASPARKIKKKENDPPLRLLDDLFRKTKMTPCVYWLPLTPEQIAEKEEIRRKRMEEHEQIRKEREREREKEREREREREKERERERERRREKERSADHKRSRSRERRRY